MTIICPEKVTSTVPLQQPLHILRLSPACSATSGYFHLPHHYEFHSMVMKVSLDTANIKAINTSALDFRIWQHFSKKLDRTPPTKAGKYPRSASHTALQRYDQQQ